MGNIDRAFITEGRNNNTTLGYKVFTDNRLSRVLNFKNMFRASLLASLINLAPTPAGAQEIDPKIHVCGDDISILDLLPQPIKEPILCHPILDGLEIDRSPQVREA